MRTFMAQINASMELDTTGVPSLQRQHDAHIMDIILELNQFTNAQVRRLNYCRMYLQAVTISDISDATGQQLDRSNMLGKPNAQSSTTIWIQINQERPSEVEWKLWRKANLLWSNVLGELRTHLGQWLVSRPRQRQQQFAYLHRNRRLYVRMGIDQYQVCLPTGTPGEYRLHPRVRAYDAVKVMAHPVHVTASVANPDYWQVDQRMHSILPTSPTDRSTTFDEFVDTLEPWEIDVLRMTTLHVNPNALCEALSSGFRAASDGPVRLMTQGSFGWVLSTDNGHQVATGMGPARGPRPASYRAEGYGLLSILRFLIRVAEFTGKVEPWSGILVTDSQSILKTLAGGDMKFNAVDEPVSIDGTTVVLDVLCPDWDLLIEIQHALSQLPGLRLKYVKGHQDDATPYAQLPLFAQLNVDADGKAGQFQDLHGQDRPVVLLTPRTHVLLHLLDGTVTSSFAASLRHAYCGPPLMEYIRIKNKWTAAVVESINWQAHGSALRKQQPLRIHYVKYVHDILPTHSQLNQMDKGMRTCPCCACTHEDHDHILRCPSSARDSWRAKLLDQLSSACGKHHTYAPLQALLLNAVRQWLYQDGNLPDAVPQCDDYAEELHSLIRVQTKIGWRQLFNGRFCLHWSNLQSEHLYHIRHHLPVKHKTGQKWQVAIITVFWKH